MAKRKLKFCKTWVDKRITPETIEQVKTEALDYWKRANVKAEVTESFKAGEGKHISTGFLLKLSFKNGGSVMKYYTSPKSWMK
jgi:mannitol-1-phosphate/altronate dehydrogenase